MNTHYFAQCPFCFYEIEFSKSEIDNEHVCSNCDGIMLKGYFSNE